MPAATGQIALDITLFAVMLFGLVSLIIPIMPGLTIIWVAVLVYAIVNGHQLLGLHPLALDGKPPRSLAVGHNAPGQPRAEPVEHPVDE